MKARIAVAVGMSFVLLMVLAPMARADWVSGMPAKWVQMPDLSPNGMDVNATYNGPFPYVKVLADDFLCTQTGPITDVHIWGSWLNDIVDPNATFKLSIHADVPAGSDATYSHPGQELWRAYFEPGQYLKRPWATANEQFFEPNTNEIIGSDTQVFQYNFNIDPAVAFVQQGDAAKPQVYWLDVQAVTAMGTVFGWKTSAIPTNFPSLDDAVFGDADYWNTPVSWSELIDPRTGTGTGQSLNMAFVITPEPATLCLLGVGALGLLARRRRK